MDPATVEMLRFAIDAPLGLYERADTIVRLLTSGNVDEVMALLPSTLRDRFESLAREIYVPRGERFAVAGSPIPEACLEAVRGWCERRDALGTARSPEVDATPFKLERPALVSASPPVTR